MNKNTTIVEMQKVEDLF